MFLSDTTFICLRQFSL